MVFKNRLSIGFSGSTGSGYLNVPNPNTTMIVGESGNGASFSLWFNYPTAQSGVQGLCCFASGPVNEFHMNPYITSGGGHINCDFRYITLTTDFGGFAPGAALPGTGWHHLVVSNKSGTGSQMWFDGVRQTNDNLTSGDSLQATSGLNFTIGTVNGGNSLNGNISDLRVYNVQLTSSQVVSLFNDQDVRAGLVARFDMTEGAGTTTTDSVGGFVATLVSSKPQWNTSSIPITFTKHGSSTYNSQSPGLVQNNTINRPQPLNFST